MVLINEWLPNPSGRDADGEWMELWNSGKEDISLKEFFLQAKSGKRLSLDRYQIDGGGYLVLTRKETKLALGNADGEIYLYQNSQLIDRAAFRGTAPEGKSYNRIGSRFSFADPTPGGVNTSPGVAALVSEAYPRGANLGPGPKGIEITGLAIALALSLSLLAVLILKKHHGLRELFFSRYEEIR